jgi:myo-inositol-1(or 4)-monophosphatase
MVIYNKINPLLGTREAAELSEKGAGGDVSMYIDLLAENTIIELLEKNDINVLLISEEVGEKYIGEESIAKKKGYKLIVDPIDGSNNASRGIPYSSVSIAYAAGDNIRDLEIGIIVDLNTKDLYWATKGNGAYMNGNRIRVSELDKSQNLLVEIDISAARFFKNLEVFRKLFKRYYKIRVMGSTALTLCQIAKGSVDAFINFRSSSRLVDAAAGYLIAKESGAQIFSLNGAELDEELLSITTRFPFVACNARLEPYLKKYLR